MAKQGQQQLFGGNWTEEKLLCLRKYLQAYTSIFSANQKAKYFRTTYVDAFAGTGIIPVPEMPLLELFQEDYEVAEEYRKGSAIHALEVEPGFDQYIFVELEKDKCDELKQRLKERFPKKSGEILVYQAEANNFLSKWCEQTDWKKNRAVVFLDPFGMSVEWSLLETIARTGAIDLWFLFPLFATNRLLVREGKPSKGWAERLTKTLGTDEWEDQFYTTTESRLIKGIRMTERTVDVDRLATYFVSRLRNIFAAVAQPLVLRNSRGGPLYLLCFAAGNEKGATTGIKIATQIIGGA